MDPYTIPEDILRLANTLPRFPDGRIDYTHADEAPVLNIYVVHNHRVLLLKRGDKVGWLKNRWHVIAGFLDDEKTLAEKALEEVYEETGIMKEQVMNLSALEPLMDVLGSKRWSIYPVVIELRELPRITLDWENLEYKWIEKEEIEKYNVLPNVAAMIKRL